MNLIESAKATWETASPFNFFATNYNNTELSLPEIAQSAINLLMFIAGVLAVAYLIYSGILYITAAGNPDSAKKGQQGIVNAIIGIVIISLAYVIVNTVIGFTIDIG